ncbi:MAG: putative toxin-antitoxin system toxin component, PIN family [Flavobacteriales bacterium]|nr:putative toxin-antitoxin system toxin component, PIN family [Flavobacteriales bacterium]
MQRLILDTNVLVSALIQKSFPYFILDYCLDGKAKVCLSSTILKEYVEVLQRPKFYRFADFVMAAETILARLNLEAEIFEPTIRLNVIMDEADNRFLELAQESKADFLITGNTNDFDFDVFGTTRIVSPKEYWENCRS